MIIIKMVIDSAQLANLTFLKVKAIRQNYMKPR